MSEWVNDSGKLSPRVTVQCMYMFECSIRNHSNPYDFGVAFISTY